MKLATLQIGEYQQYEKKAPPRRELTAECFELKDVFFGCVWKTRPQDVQHANSAVSGNAKHSTQALQKHKLVRRTYVRAPNPCCSFEQCSATAGHCRPRTRFSVSRR